MASRLMVFIAVVSAVMLITTPSDALDVSLTGTWSHAIDESDLLAGPGSDLAPTYESLSDQISIDILNSLGGGDSWRIDVSKSDVTWTSSIKLYVKRTSSGSGGSVFGGGSYLEVSSSDQTLFSGTDDVLGIDLQYKLDNISVSITPSNYVTTIVYTIVDT